MSDYIIYLLFLFVFTIIYGLLCFAITNQQQNNYGLVIGQNLIKWCINKKTPYIIKEELLRLLIEIEKEDEAELEKAVKKLKESKEAIMIVMRYKDILKIKKRNISLAQQGPILKCLKESEGFMKTVGFSRFNIYLKISLHKFLSKYPLLKRSTLASNYFKS